MFRGQYYTFEDGVLTLEGSWSRIGSNILQAKKKLGNSLTPILKRFAETGESYGIKDFEQKTAAVKVGSVLSELEKSKIITMSYQAGDYREWKILEETLPLVKSELGMAVPEPREAQAASASAEGGQEDYVQEEKRRVEQMDRELAEYLNSLMKLRLEKTIEFGKTFTTSALVKYLRDLFGTVLYFDSLLSIIQQYGLSDTEIVHPKGKTGMRTGFSLALFGEPRHRQELLHPRHDSGQARG